MDSRAPNIKPITTYFKETFKESLARKGYRRQIGWTLLGMVFFYDFFFGKFNFRPLKRGSPVGL